MQFINSDQVRISINKTASKQTPFFFTVDYEMSEGLFIENPIRLIPKEVQQTGGDGLFMEKERKQGKMVLFSLMLLG